MRERRERERGDTHRSGAEDLSDPPGAEDNAQREGHEGGDVEQDAEELTKGPEEA